MARENCPRKNESCKYFVLPGGCFADVHHEYWPRKEYRSKLEKAFREHVLHKVVICRAAHDELHATTRPPRKPSIDEMRDVLDI